MPWNSRRTTDFKLILKWLMLDIPVDLSWLKLLLIIQAFSPMLHKTMFSDYVADDDSAQYS